MELLTLSTIWAIASALAIGTIGIVSLKGRRARPRGAFAFGLFAVFWSMQILLANIANTVGDADWAGVTYLAFLAVSLPTTYFLVEFASSQSPTGGKSLGWRSVRIGAAVAGAVGALVLLLDPALLMPGVTDAALPIRGPLVMPLIVLPHYTAFGLALIALWRGRIAAPTPRVAERSSILLAGLSIFVAFAAGNNLTFFVGTRVLFPTFAPLETTIAILVFTALAGLVLHVAVHALRQARAATRRDERAASMLIPLATLGPFAFGVVEALLALGPMPYLNSVGLWRLAAVAILAYGIARWRSYDLPHRAARAAASAGGAAAAVAGGAAAYGATTLVASGPGAPAVVGVLVVAGLFAPGVRLATRIFDRAKRAPVEERDAHVYGQRVDAYRAALEASLARGTLDEDAEFLAALRERFGIDASEHRLLLHYANAAVLVGSERSADAAYERLRLLGEGGAGRTWLARDRVRDRLVVLKEPIERWQRDPQLREAVLREARLAARVRHPNVVTVEDVVDHKGMPVIVMEYCEAGSLRGVLHHRGTLPWKEAVKVTIDILRGVEAIHAAGVIHRDLKPSNVLLDGDGAPKIADFGIALPASSSKTLVEGGTTFAGTISYVAPEVRMGAMADRRSDVYSVGAILHECLHGAPPGFAVQARAEGVPVALESALARALSPVPEKRPPSARALAEELTTLVDL